MLSTLECIGIKEILNDLDDGELFSLLETVTKHMFVACHRQEAIEKILACTGKPSDLLRRQKITKKILFNYLMKKEAAVLAEWTKPTLVYKCLALWNSTESCTESDFVEAESQKQPSGGTESQQQPPDGTECQKPVFVEREVNIVMGVEFAKWFFRLLNTLDGFGPEHFWPSCNLSAQLCTLCDQKEVSVSGSDNVATFLANLVLIDKFYFHANDSKESVMLEVERHGLIKIIIHGVLHQHSNCVGLFNSAFGLVKQPDSPDTYKIQVIMVKMQLNNSPQRELPANNCLSIRQAAS